MLQQNYYLVYVEIQPANYNFIMKILLLILLQINSVETKYSSIFTNSVVGFLTKTCN